MIPYTISNYINERSLIVSSSAPVTDEKVWISKSKNLLKNALETTTINGITITKYSNGSLKVNGTATSDIYLTIGKLKLLAGKAYTLSGCDNASSTTIRLHLSDDIGNLWDNWLLPDKPTETMTVDKVLYVKLRIISGTVLTNKMLYPMIEVGSQATSFEPYVAPTIQTEQDEIYNKDDILDELAQSIKIVFKGETGGGGKLPTSLEYIFTLPRSIYANSSH